MGMQRHAFRGVGDGAAGGAADPDFKRHCLCPAGEMPGAAQSQPNNGRSRNRPCEKFQTIIRCCSEPERLVEIFHSATSLAVFLDGSRGNIIVAATTAMRARGRSRGNQKTKMKAMPPAAIAMVLVALSRKRLSPKISATNSPVRHLHPSFSRCAAAAQVMSASILIGNPSQAMDTGGR